ncbi:MAG: PQQ-binding-like beta-propeller repeat protein, partial [Pseudonocardia sp.]
DPQPLGLVAFALGVAAIAAFIELLALREGPFPGDRVLLVTTAYGVMLLGTVAVIRAGLRLPPRPPTVRSRRGAVGFIAAMTAVAVTTGLAVAVAGDHSRIDATTTSATPAPPTPADLTRVAWRWTEGEEIFAAVPAGAGVVVATTRGIVALDGRTGEERWHYRRDNARPMDLAAVEAGRGVIASIEGRLHAFDAFTGELRWRHEPSTTRESPEWYFGLDATDSTVVRTREGYGDSGTYQFELAGTDVRTGTMTWRYSPPPGCEREGDEFVAGMVIVTLGGCAPPQTVELVALDGSTGQPVWRELVDEYGSSWGGLLELSTLDDPDDEYVDPRTGREIAGLAPLLGEWDSVMEFGSDEVITHDWRLFRLGEPAPRWQAQDTSPRADGAIVPAQAVVLDHVVAILDGRSCPGDETGLDLVVLDRDDGTRRRSFECEGLSQEDGHDAVVFRAPGAVVLVDMDSLVGIVG